MNETIQKETTAEERLRLFLHGKCAYRHHLEDGLMDVINIELKKAYDEGVKEGKRERKDNEKVYERS